MCSASAIAATGRIKSKPGDYVVTPSGVEKVINWRFDVLSGEIILTCESNEYLIKEVRNVTKADVTELEALILNI